MRIALTIAGSDSGGGAGIQADLKTFAALGVYGTCAITSITAQNTVGVLAASSQPADVVVAQMEAVAGDMKIDAAKTGMLATAAIVEAVAAAVQTLEIPRLVVDPVMVAKSGDRLLEEDAVQALKTELLPRAFLVTPNILEAELLAGQCIRSPEDVRTAARRIHALGPSAVVVKGGHLVGRDSIDLLYDGQAFQDFVAPRFDTKNTHGTGCTFSAAIVAYLAHGRTLADAIAAAKSYVTAAIEHGLEIGHGHGPLNHFWAVRS